jgi:hypothetical protein
VFSLFLGGSKEHFSFALRILLGLLFVFTFIESVGWVVIVVSLRFDFSFLIYQSSSWKVNTKFSFKILFLLVQRH